MRPCGIAAQVACRSLDLHARVRVLPPGSNFQPSPISESSSAGPFLVRSHTRRAARRQTTRPCRPRRCHRLNRSSKPPWRRPDDRIVQRAPTVSDSMPPRHQSRTVVANARPNCLEGERGHSIFRPSVPVPRRGVTPSLGAGMRRDRLRMFRGEHTRVTGWRHAVRPRSRRPAAGSIRSDTPPAARASGQQPGHPH